MEANGDGADSGVLGIQLRENCTNRCWNAGRETCRCACGGLNHGAMQPGSGKLVQPRGCAQIQTVMRIHPEAPMEPAEAPAVEEPDRSGPDPWKPEAEAVKAAIERLKGRGSPCAALTEGIGPEEIGRYLAEEYRTPASLQERVDLEAERCALEIIVQAERPGAEE